MTRLRVGLVPGLDEELCNTLIQNGFRSVESVLRVCVEEIVRATGLSKEDVDLVREELIEELDAFRPHVVEALNDEDDKSDSKLLADVEKLDGSEHSDTTERHIFCSTGIQRLDDIFGGGLPCGDIVQVVGHSGVGKSQLLLSMVAASLVNGNMVYFLDSTGVLSSTERLVELLQHKMALPSKASPSRQSHSAEFLPAKRGKYERSRQHTPNDLQPASLLKNLRRCPVFDPWEALEALANLTELLKEEKRAATTSMSYSQASLSQPIPAAPPTAPIQTILVIDSLPSIFSRVIGLNSQGYALLVTLSVAVRELMHVTPLACVVANNLQRSGPALGAVWARIPQHTLTLSIRKERNGGGHITYSSSSSFLTQTIPFKVSDRGIIS